MSLASERLEASSVSSPAKDSPFGFIRSPGADEWNRRTVITEDRQYPGSCSSVHADADDADEGKNSLQARWTRCPAFETRAQTHPSISRLSAPRARHVRDDVVVSNRPCEVSELPAWKAQSPIEIYDQVLDSDRTPAFPTARGTTRRTACVDATLTDINSLRCSRVTEIRAAVRRARSKARPRTRFWRGRAPRSFAF